MELEIVPEYFKLMGVKPYRLTPIFINRRKQDGQKRTGFKLKSGRG